MESTTPIAHTFFIRLFTDIQEVKELVHRWNPWKYKLLLPQILSEFNVPGYLLQSRGDLKIREMKDIVDMIPESYQSLDQFFPWFDLKIVYKSTQLFFHPFLTIFI